MYNMQAKEKAEWAKLGEPLSGHERMEIFQAQEFLKQAMFNISGGRFSSISGPTRFSAASFSTVYDLKRDLAEAIERGSPSGQRSVVNHIKEIFRWATDERPDFALIEQAKDTIRRMEAAARDSLSHLPTWAREAVRVALWNEIRELDIAISTDSARMLEEDIARCESILPPKYKAKVRNLGS